MVCIYCSAPTQVTNSRLQRRLNQVWRRRTCSVCHNTFTTHEVADLGSTVVVRYSTRDIRPFSRDALFVSVYDSCKHRPTALTDADGLTRTIIAQLRKKIQDGSIQRSDILSVTTDVLQRFDTAAATVYHAYHT